MIPYPAFRRVAALLAGFAAAPGPVVWAQGAPLIDLRDLTPRELRSAGFVLTAPESLAVEAVGVEEPGKDGEDEPGMWLADAWIIDTRTRDLVWDLRTAETKRSGNGVHRFRGSIRLPAGVYQAYYGSYVATSVSYRGKSFLSWGRKSQGDSARYGGRYVDDNTYREFGLQVTGAGRAATPADLDAASRDFTASAAVTLRPTPGTQERVGFTLDRPAEAVVYAVGELKPDGAFDYGWIINADTRKPVWRMEYPETSEAGGDPKNRLARERIHLDAGRYVAYFTSDESHGPGKWTSLPPYDLDSWGLSVRIADRAARAGVHRFEWQPVPAGQTIVSLIRVGNDQLRFKGFALRRPLEVRIYALGEGINPGGEMDDYAWMVDADSHRRIWAMTYANTEAAGGAEKNRLFDGTLNLPAGNYLMYYRTDDNHSYPDWNDAPPAEPEYWGVSVFPASGRLNAAVVGPYAPSTGGMLADLAKMRSGRHSHRSFSLDRPTQVRIYAVGEGVNSRMVDYGWIENRKTGQRVWEMTYGSTTAAGGAKKNRMFNGTIRLPAGHYQVFFETDDSHAYGDWNSDPPDDPAGWGITLRVDHP
jgi:hypothetical protein